MAENQNINVATPETEEKQYSSLRYAWGAFAAFFGFTTRTHRGSKKRAKLVADIVTYAVLLFGAFIMIYPFWWMLAGSFAYTENNGNTQLYTMVWWPVRSTFDNGNRGAFANYIAVFERGFTGIRQTFWRVLLNNILYSTVPVVVGVLTSASAAFSFAKINWIGRNVVFYFLLAAIMVPGPSLMISQYVMYVNLGWANNGLALIIPGLFGSIMTAFFIRQFLFGLPTSIIEAAKIDGAGYFRIFCGFILPLAMPAIMAQGILSFMGCWNNYMGSFLFVRNTEWYNLPHAISTMESQSTFASNFAPVIAASVVCVLPVMILFGCFQKLIIGSLMLTGSKE